jgi:hypothetical protein
MVDTDTDECTPEHTAPRQSSPVHHDLVNFLHLEEYLECEDVKDLWNLINENEEWGVKLLEMGYSESDFEEWDIELKLDLFYDIFGIEFQVYKNYDPQPSQRIQDILQGEKNLPHFLVLIVVLVEDHSSYIPEILTQK